MTDEPESEVVAEPAEQPKRGRRRKPAMPEALKERARNGGAVSRAHGKRYPVPEVAVIRTGASWCIENPYRDSDEAEWWRLLGEAFGTRTVSVIMVFMDQVAGLVGTVWDEEAKATLPDENEIYAALSIVAAMKPRNEAEAAQAAQAFALHTAAMKTGAGIVRGSYVDPRQSNALANLAKAYSGVMDSMRKRGRTSTTRQIIKVEKNVTINNDNRSVHLRGGGRPGADQSDASDGTTRARPRNGRTPCNGDGTGQLINVPALPSPPEMRDTLPSASGEGPECVPDARRKVAGRP